MEFFKEWRQERREVRDEKKFLKTLSPDFQMWEEPWCFNRHHDLFRDGRIAYKARFAFDEPSQLKATDMQAKIGVNADKNIPHSFIGFVYASEANLEKLKAYAHQYPWAEIIDNLDSSGLSTEKSEHTPLADTESHD
ncbi:MAG: hypothetical protein KGH56_01675 [Patescibacteria group bacterium]|nr:hypothetical protein [Patescibacteria group bacterium]